MRLQELKSKLVGILEGKNIDFLEIKEELPFRMTVEAEKMRFEISNECLFKKLEKIKTVGDPEKRSQMILETIGVIDAVLVEIEKLQDTTNSTIPKDETKKKLQEILSQPDYAEPRELGQGWVEKKIEEVLDWITRLLNWLRHLLSNSIPRKSNVDSTASLVTRILIYVIVSVLALFLLFWIRKYFVENRRECRESEERVILGEQLSERDNANDLFSDAERLASEGKLRQAIRKSYIALLFSLGQKRILRISRNKTNRDYLREISSNSSIYPEVSDITEEFERVWYGFTEPQVEDWKSFRTKCLQVLNAKESNSRD